MKKKSALTLILVLFCSAKAAEKHEGTKNYSPRQSLPPKPYPFPRDTQSLGFDQCRQLGKDIEDAFKVAHQLIITEAK
jgi:hypothetical protein